VVVPAFISLSLSLTLTLTNTAIPIPTVFPQDNEEEGFTTLTQAEYEALSEDEVGWTDTRRVQYGLSLGGARRTGASSNYDETQVIDSSERDQQTPGLAQKLDDKIALSRLGSQKKLREVNHESYGESKLRMHSTFANFTYNGDSEMMQSERGSYGQRTRSVQEEKDLMSAFAQGPESNVAPKLFESAPIPENAPAAEAAPIDRRKSFSKQFTV
jgi:hypothetical protein